MNHDQQAKLKSENRWFLFFREKGFYVLQLSKDTVADNAKCNPGTVKVVDALTKEVVWSRPEQEGGQA